MGKQNKPKDKHNTTAGKSGSSTAPPANEDNSTTKKKHSSSMWVHVTMLSLVLGVVGVCYSNALEGGFVIDDSEAVVRNRDLRPDAGFAQMWKDDFWGNLIWGNISHKSYRPMCVLTFKLDRIIGEWYYGLNSTDIALREHSFSKGDTTKHIEAALGETPQCLAPFYHKVNVAYYALTCVAVYALLLHITEGDVIVTSAATLLFAAHPIHTEAVTSIVGRAEVLCMLFAIAGYFAYVRAAATPHRTHWCWLLLSMALVFLATVSKETGLTYVGLYLAYDILYVADTPSKRPTSLTTALGTLTSPSTKVFGLLGRVATCVGTVLGITYFRYRLNGCFKNPANRFVENPIMFSSGLRKWLSLPLDHAKYLQLLVYPHTMSSDYSFDCIPLIDSLRDPRNLYGLAAYASLAAVGLLALRSFSRPALMGLAVLLCTAFPLTNILVAVGTMVGERLLFSPSLGFCLLVACALAWLARRPWKYSAVWKCSAAVLAVTATVMYGHRTYTRNPDWNTGDSIFLSAYKVCPRSVKILFVLGSGAIRNGRYDEGMEYFRRAEDIAKPRHLCEIDFEVGKAYVNQGKVLEAAEFLLKGLRCPYTKGYSFDYIRKLTSFIAERPSLEMDTPYFSKDLWARTLETVNLTAEASGQYLAIAQDAWNTKNPTQQQHRDTDIAQKYALKAAAVNPSSCIAQEWAGKILTEMGKYKEAIPYLKAASFKHNCSGNSDSTLWYLIKVYDILIPENSNYRPELYAAINRLSEKEKKKLQFN